MSVAMGEWKALRALTEESRALSAVLLPLDPDAFARSTNCPPWNLKELVVHTATSIRLHGDFPDPQPGARPRSAADYYRRPKRATHNIGTATSTRPRNWRHGFPPG
jgi:hypothetical protein